MTGMTKRPRAERRKLARDAVKTAKARLRVALRGVGGSPQNPVSVSSASVVESHALGLACAACGEHGTTRLEEHAAVVISGARLRVAKIACRACGVRRDLYYSLAPSLLS